MTSPWDFPEGMTVTELKELIKDWPEKHRDILTKPYFDQPGLIRKTHNV